MCSLSPYMDTILKFKIFAKLIRVDESLSSLLKQEIKKEKSARFIPENYFYVTHVTNPIKFYWESQRKEIIKTSEISRKLFLGKRLERIARAWFRNLPAFSFEEGKLDGVWVDIPGVRGSVDYRIRDSLIEFKTKDKLPETGIIVLEKYPQDLEQLAFYSAMHPEHPKDNYLVFMNNIPPYQLRAFKVRILDPGMIKKLLLDRIATLRTALKEKDPSKLGRCRYYETGCEYHLSNACTCGNTDPLSTESLKKAIEISFDEPFTNMLIESKETSSSMEGVFSTKDIIAPRKYYLNNHLEKESKWKSDSKREEYLACLGNLVRKLGLNLTPEDANNIKKLLKEKRMYIAQRWLKLKTSTKESREIVPYTIKISGVSDMKYTSKPSGYALAELAIICASYGRFKGLIFTVFPELDDHIQVYEVIFRDTKQILEEVKKTLDNMEIAIKNEDLSVLDPCPEFMNDNEKCFLIKECHKEEIGGCKRF